MKLVIIGATGYIGESLFALANKVGNARGTSSVGSDTLIPLRLDAPDVFDYSVIQDSDVVLVTAAISAPDVCSGEHEHAWAVNVTGTSLFISKTISRGARIIFFSSDTVYGERAEDFDETAACHPVGEYAVMKHEVERRFIGNPAFKTIRLSYVFSKEDKFTKYLRGCVQQGVEAEIFHPFYRAIIHRDDVVQGALALAQRWDEIPQNIINFGGPEVLARTEFAKILRDAALPDLRFRVIEPDADFFKNRPKVIRMASPVLTSLLGRPARTLHEAADIEFERMKHD